LAQAALTKSDNVPQYTITTLQKIRGDTMHHLIRRTLCLILAVGSSASFAQEEYGSPDMIKAAAKEGKIMLYTTLDKDNTMRAIEAFNKRFPAVQVQVLRVPGGQLVTRVQAEAAANKLAADVIAFSDLSQVEATEAIFADYAPPNAQKYPGDGTPQKAWPYALAAWCIGYNRELVKNPPQAWTDLTQPAYKNKVGEVTILTGGTGWTRSMFQREVLGDNYWPSLAQNQPKIYPSGVPMSDALIRGEITVAAILSNQILPRAKEGAPITCNFPKEGVPISPIPAGIVKTSKAPNAARLFLNWSLSAEGQAMTVNDWKMFSALKGAPMPEGADPKVHKVWVPDAAKSSRVREAWTKEWTQTFNFRQ
jgi:iron(III) transport system substrate-binding protein